MKKKCVIISDSQEYDIDLINNLIEKSEFEYVQDSVDLIKVIEKLKLVKL